MASRPTSRGYWTKAVLEALFALDPVIVLSVGAFVVVALVSVGVYAIIAAQVGPRAKFKRRLALVAGERSARSGDRPGQDGSRRREMQEKLKDLDEGKKAKKRRRNQIRDEIRQAGLSFNVRQYAIGSAVLGFVGVVAMLVFGFNVLAALLVGVTLGLGVPKFYLSHMRKRRLKIFTSQFATAIDVIVRGIQSGLPVGECLTIIGRESSEPVAGEFRQIVDSIQIGLTLEESLTRAVERMPSQDLRFFAIVLQIQAQTGGNLAETLENLSTVLRDRKKMKDKVKAMAAEANASAAIIGSLPFVVCLLLLLVNPTYLGILFTDDFGQILVVAGLTWMSIGVFVMRQMINFEI